MFRMIKQIMVHSLALITKKGICVSKLTPKYFSPLNTHTVHSLQDTVIWIATAYTQDQIYILVKID